MIEFADINTNKCRRQHSKLITLAERIISLLNENDLAIDAQPVRQQLSKFINHLNKHLWYEDTKVYPAIHKHNDETLKVIAEQFSKSEHELVKIVQSYNNKWVKAETIQQYAGVFINETRELINILEKRIRREDNYFFPLIDVIKAEQTT